MIVEKHDLLNIIEKEITKVLSENFNINKFLPSKGDEDTYFAAALEASKELIKIHDPGFGKIMKNLYAWRDSNIKDDFYHNIDPLNTMTDAEYADMNSRGDAPWVSSKDDGHIHTVKKGETLTSIGKKYSMPWNHIWRYNSKRYKGPKYIQPDDELTIPPRYTLKNKDGGYSRTSGLMDYGFPEQGSEPIKIFSEPVINEKNFILKRFLSHLKRQKKIKKLSDKEINKMRDDGLRNIFLLVSIELAATLVHETYHLTDEMDPDSELYVQRFVSPGVEDESTEEERHEVEIRAFKYEGAFLEKIYNSGITKNSKWVTKLLKRLISDAKSRKITWQYGRHN